MTTTNSSAEKTHVTDRTYGQYCPIAAGLDLIGDRWTLLILRELSMGDQRFTDEIESSGDGAVLAVGAICDMSLLG